MQFLTELWLPILLSGVFVFVVSSVIHMATPIHKKDMGKLPGEDKVLEAMHAQGVQPGEYRFPYAETMKEMDSPEMREKLNRGPVGLLTVLPSGPCNMNKSLIQWFLFSVLIGVFAAYVARHALPDGAAYLSVFRVAGTAAFLGYGIGHLHNSIWKGASWSTTGKFVFDGLVYALVTAGTFAWLWPEAAA